MSNNLIPIILAGGSGKRLYPFSSQEDPKQFKILKNKSLLEETIDRAISITNKAPLVITNRIYKNKVQDLLSLKQILNNNLIIEPLAKNTAAAIINVAFLNKKEDPYLLILPSDHYVENNNFFKLFINKYIKEQNKDLLLFGKKSNEINENYGQIKIGNKKSENLFSVEKFLEKPSGKIQEEIFNGNYIYNTGIYLMKCSTLLNELFIYDKDLYLSCEKCVNNKIQKNNVIYFKKENYENIKNISIDYSLIEKTNKLNVSLIDFDWFDLGSYNSIYNYLDKDLNANAIIGNVTIKNSYNNLIITDKKLIIENKKNNIIININNKELIYDLYKK